MNKLLILLFFLAVSNALWAQEAQYAYRVKFTDKNASAFSIDNPEEFLSQRAIDRRSKYNIAINSTDLPVNETYIDSVLELTDGVLHCSSKWFNDCVILVTDTSEIQNLSGINFIDEIKKVGYYPLGLHNKPNDSEQDNPLDEYDTNYYAAAWTQIHLCNGEYMHQHGFMGQGMLIAVLDVGFANANTIEDFDSMFQQGRMVDAFNFIRKNSDVFSSGTHGTNVLSCMAANTPHTYVGTAPKAMYALYATDDAVTENSLEQDNWIAAAERADSVGADLITTSVGYNTFDDDENSYTYEQLDGHTTLVAKAANIAVSKGILVIASAGNEGTTSWQHILTPGDADSTLTVGSVNYQKSVASNSGYGPNASGLIKPNVCTQGVQAAVVSSGGDHTNITGTSFATPILAGMAACLMQAAPNKMPTEIRYLIESVSDHFSSPDNHIGYGVPDFAQAFNTVGIENTEEKNGVNIYPNPVKNILCLHFDKNYFSSVDITITDVSGRLVQHEERNIRNQIITIDVSQISAGMYILKAVSKELQQELKLIKQ